MAWAVKPLTDGVFMLAGIALLVLLLPVFCLYLLLVRCCAAPYTPMRKSEVRFQAFH